MIGGRSHQADRPPSARALDPLSPSTCPNACRNSSNWTRVSRPSFRAGAAEHLDGTRGEPDPVLARHRRQGHETAQQKQPAHAIIVTGPLMGQTLGPRMRVKTRALRADLGCPKLGGPVATPRSGLPARVVSRTSGGGA
jgi:hypothetical protein